MTVKSSSKKNDLVELSEKLFLEKGYEETSIEDILRASGLSKGGFYHYFKSKEEVLVESINNLADALLKESQGIIEDKKINALEKVNLFMEKKVAFQKPKKEIAKYFAMLMKSDFTFYKFSLAIAKKYVNPLAEIIQQGVEEGIFDVEFPTETADILIRAVTSVPQSVFYNDYIEDENKALRYKTSLKLVFARALAIDETKLRIFPE